MRLPRKLPARPQPVPLAPDAPITVFFPAWNEEATIAGLIARLPDQIACHPIRTLVIDDGSTDRTAARAAAAGAQVVSFGTNRGLGAAVRAGLANGVAAGSVATVFLDADAEYQPGEIADLVMPILDGSADYVTGSRFAGRIEHMRPHRRLGNRILTRGLSWLTRRSLSDGQSGYRALSARAAAAAEVIHDYNYAQVLTLDLLAKGFAHREVPISYRFRTTGDSFVSLPRYLRQCIPAIQAELKSSPAILDLKPTVLGPRTTLATTRRAPPAVLARP